MTDEINTVRLAQEVGQIQGTLPSLATKKDVSDAALATTRWAIGIGVVILVAQIGVWLHILSRLPLG